MYLEFLKNQFRRRGIPEGSGKYEDFELCKKLIQMQGKLNVRSYQEMLNIALEYSGYKEPAK